MAELAVVSQGCPGSTYELLDAGEAVVDVEDNEGCKKRVALQPLGTCLPQKLGTVHPSLVPACRTGIMKERRIERLTVTERVQRRQKKQ